MNPLPLKLLKPRNSRISLLVEKTRGASSAPCRYTPITTGSEIFAGREDVLHLVGHAKPRALPCATRSATAAMKGVLSTSMISVNLLLSCAKGRDFGNRPCAAHECFRFPASLLDRLLLVRGQGVVERL